MSIVDVMAGAMKKRAAEPLGNIQSLEPILVGSLGDAWVHLARAALSALETMEIPKAVIEAAIKVPEEIKYEDGAIVMSIDYRAIWSAMLAAAKEKK